MQQHTFNESHILVTQQMDNMYKYLKQKVSEAQNDLNILSDVAKSRQNLRPELFVEDAQLMRMNLTTEQDDSLVLSQHLPLVQDSF